MKELAAALLLNLGSKKASKDDIMSLLKAVDIAGDEKVVDTLVGDMKDVDIAKSDAEGREKLEIFKNIGGGSSGGAAATGDAAAPAEEEKKEEEEEEEESSAAAG